MVSAKPFKSNTVKQSLRKHIFYLRNGTDSIWLNNLVLRLHSQEQRLILQGQVHLHRPLVEHELNFFSLPVQEPEADTEVL